MRLLLTLFFLGFLNFFAFDFWLDFEGRGGGINNKNGLTCSQKLRFLNNVLKNIYKSNKTIFIRKDKINQKFILIENWTNKFQCIIDSKLGPEVARIYCIGRVKTVLFYFKNYITKYDHFGMLYGYLYEEIKKYICKN